MAKPCELQFDRFNRFSLNVVDLDSRRSSDYDSKPIARNRRKQDFLLIIGSFSNFVSNQLFVEPYRKIFYFFFFFFLQNAHGIFRIREKDFSRGINLKSCTFNNVAATPLMS